MRTEHGVFIANLSLFCVHQRSALTNACLSVLRAVVYFPSCANRVMGVSTSEEGEGRTLTDVTLSVLGKANYDVTSTSSPGT
jgi:hypothetical protein